MNEKLSHWFALGYGPEVKLSTNAYATSAVLSVAVIGSFAVLQDYGPESAIRRFHQAAVEGNARILQRTMIQQLGDQYARTLISQVRFLARSGAYPRSLRMDRQNRRVNAAVVYQFPDGRTGTMIWVVEKPKRTWRVNAERTIKLLLSLR